MTDEKAVEVLCLDKLADGAADELFRAAMTEVLANIADPNTEATKSRRITLTITITPREDRKAAATDIDLKVALPGTRPVSTVLFLGREAGVLLAREAPTNLDLFKKDAKPALRKVAAATTEGDEA